MKEKFKDNGQCIGCGYCCTVAPCCYGEWDDKAKKCVYLTPDNRCGCYDIIVVIEKEWPLLPMFGTGCSSTLLNTRREDKIKEINNT